MPLSTDINFPSKPEVVSESEDTGVYKIDGLYPGYGYTLGNSLRRIILSSLTGAAITSVQIENAKHEFATIEGVKEDVITMLMNLKNVRFSVSTEEEQTATLSADTTGTVTAGDIDTPGQMEIANPDLVIAHITGDDAALNMELRIETGLGYVSKEDLKDDKLSAGEMALDADFSPIRRVNYQVEDMRVGDRTDFNSLEVTIETDGTISPRKALEDSIEIMIRQLQSVIEMDESVAGPVLSTQDRAGSGTQGDAADEVAVETQEHTSEEEKSEANDDQEAAEKDFHKTRIERLDLPTRTKNALERASIRTAGGLVQKTRDELLEIEGLGDKGVDEIQEILEEHGASLKKDE